MSPTPRGPSVGQPSSFLPMSCYDFAENGERWLLDVSTNNVATRVERIRVVSRWDFEVEEIVCGGVAWDERPRDVLLASDRPLALIVREFHPPSPDRAIVPRGRHQLVIVASSRATVPRDDASIVAERASGSHISAFAIGPSLCGFPENRDFREADEATHQLFAPAARSLSPSASQRQIQAYLEQIRAGRADRARAGAGMLAMDRRESPRPGGPDDVRIRVDREFEDWE